MDLLREQDERLRQYVQDIIGEIEVGNNPKGDEILEQLKLGMCAFPIKEQVRRDKIFLSLQDIEYDLHNLMRVICFYNSDLSEIKEDLYKLIDNIIMQLQRHQQIMKSNENKEGITYERLCNSTHGFFCTLDNLDDN